MLAYVGVHLRACLSVCVTVTQPTRDMCNPKQTSITFYVTLLDHSTHFLPDSLFSEVLKTRISTWFHAHLSDPNKRYGHN